MDFTHCLFSCRYVVVLIILYFFQVDGDIAPVVAVSSKSSSAAAISDGDLSSFWQSTSCYPLQASNSEVNVLYGACKMGLCSTSCSAYIDGNLEFLTDGGS